MLLYRFKVTRKLTLIIENLFFNIYYAALFKNRISIFGFPIISIAKGASVQIGKNLTLISSSFFSEPGICQPVIIRLLNKNAKLVIGNNVGISGGCICSQTAIRIGSNCLIGANVKIMDTDFHPQNPQNRRYSTANIYSKEIVIDDNVFIGMNTLILKGSYIGKNTIIGAGSVVVGEIPPNSIAVGNPAKVVKKIDIL